MTTAAALTSALADRYRVERELGQGGMATVYLAHDLRHDRDVAIKVLHPDLGAALGAERFLAETRTTAKLQHPHILALLDSGAAASLLYYVMPYVTGETLRVRLERERQLPLADALRIAREVADALSAAHALGIIHRDIKPENILLQGGHTLVQEIRDGKITFDYKLTREGASNVGGVVVVFYKTPMIWKYADGRVDGRTELWRKFTHTWMKVGGKWQIIGGMCGADASRS